MDSKRVIRVPGKERARAATTERGREKRRCPLQSAGLYRRHGESSAAGTVAASAVDLRHQTLADGPNRMWFGSFRDPFRG